MPILSRQTTYSSLPPSPRDEVELEFTRGLGIKELKDVLSKLNAEARPGTARADHGDEVRLETPRETEGVKDGRESIRLTPETSEKTDEGKKRVGGLGIWDLLKDEVGSEEWDAWVVDGKWCSYSSSDTSS